MSKRLNSNQIFEVLGLCDSDSIWSVFSFYIKTIIVYEINYAVVSVHIILTAHVT